MIGKHDAVVAAVRALRTYTHANCGNTRLHTIGSDGGRRPSVGTGACSVVVRRLGLFSITISFR